MTVWNGLPGRLLRVRTCVSHMFYSVTATTLYAVFPGFLSHGAMYLGTFPCQEMQVCLKVLNDCSVPTACSALICLTMPLLSVMETVFHVSVLQEMASLQARLR